MKKILCIIVISCFMIVGLSYVSYKANKMNYWKEIGITEYSALYSTLVECKGEPESIRYRDDGEGVYAVYDGVEFYFPNRDFKGVFLSAMIYSDKYTFGRKHITIGTKRDVVESYFRFAKKAVGSGENELTYICNDWTVIWFDFDESNCVSRITLSRDCP